MQFAIFFPRLWKKISMQSSSAGTSQYHIYYNYIIKCGETELYRGILKRNR